MKLNLTDEQIKNVFNTLWLMCSNAEIAKKMDNKQLKDYIIHSDIYGKLKINSLDIACLEEVLERLHKTTSEEELAFAE